MKNKRARTLLARLEARCLSDANNASLIRSWRFAAAHVSGMLSMKAELLP